MSQENVELTVRMIEAGNRRDLAALLEGLDPAVEWHPAINMALGGETAVYRGHEGIRQMFREADEVFAETQYEFSEIRDLGNRLLALGRARMRGKESGAETESPIGFLVDFRNGKAVRVQSFLDAREALEAAGLRE